MATTTTPARYSVIANGATVRQFARKDAAVKSILDAIEGGATGTFQVLSPAGREVFGRQAMPKAKGAKAKGVGVCERCGKELVSEGSVAAGVGPVCAAGGRGGASRGRAAKGILKATGGEAIEFNIRKVGEQDYILSVLVDGIEVVSISGISTRDCYGTALSTVRSAA